MVKCAVCGSENEPQALFCGTCGSPMPQAAPKPVEEAVTPEPPPPPPPPDDTVIPGKGDARRDLGIDTGTTVVPAPTDGDADVTDQETMSGGPTITCSVCGTVNDASRTYCRKCANELHPAAPPPPPPPPPAEVRRISPLALGLGAAAVVVAIALVVVLVMGGGTPGATLGPSAAASPGGSAAATLLPTVGPTVLPTQRVFNFSEAKLTGTIAFARCPSDGSSCVIYIRKADSSAKASRVIGASTGSTLAPAISNSGKKIVYSVEPGLRVATISSRSFVQHSSGSGDTDAVWSPDDKQIAFAGHRSRDTGSGNTDLELRLDGATSGSSVPLTSNDIPDVEPWFTPDGKSIVWIQGEGSSAEIKMIDIASKVVTDLTSDTFEDHEPSVSPDGNLIAFVSNRGSSGEFELYLLDLASPTHEIFPVVTGQTNVHNPAWSPGGRYIVFSAGKPGAEGLFIIDLNTGTTTNFTSADGADLSPTWH
jgi:dipeptidyl aminopeptidase/acylaminoacyl peptidase